MKEFKKGEGFYEELLLLRAQEVIAELMNKNNINKVQLAKLLGTSKSHVTMLLSSGRNLTLKSLARICFKLGCELDFIVKEKGKLK